MDTKKKRSKRRRSSTTGEDAPGAKRRKSPQSAPDQAQQPQETLAQPPKPSKPSNPSKRPNPKPAVTKAPHPAPMPLSDFHEATLTALRPKYNVLPASVISSHKIRARVTRVVEHLQPKPDPKPNLSSDDAGVEGAGAGARIPPVVLLHARPAEVCKMITIAEKAKSVLAGKGCAVYQYNHLFELPARPEEPAVVEETVLGGAGGEKGEVDEEDEESDDGFEKLDIFDKAANPKPAARPARSLGIFISTVPVQELKTRAGISLQTSEDAPP